jgi:hypothetical protein
MISWSTSNSSPLTGIRYTGVILFVPRRSYRNMNPARPLRFFIASSIWKIYSRAHSCAGTRPHRTDLGVLSSCGTQTFYRGGHDLRYFNRLPCLAIGMSEIVGFFEINCRCICCLPSIMVFTIDNGIENFLPCLPKVIFIGYATVFLMKIAPKDMVGYLGRVW